jgi:hypothetical protein
VIGRRSLARAGGVLAAAALLGSAGWVAPNSAQARDRARADSIAITVDSITPSTPAPSQKLRSLTVTLTLLNTSGADLEGVRILGERGDPIATQDALDAALADPTPATDSVAIEPKRPVTVDLPSGTPVQATFATTSGIPIEAGLCLCHENAVYPLFFSAHTVENGVDELRGIAATYVPSFWHTTPKRLHISWVWPLLERPHRLSGDTQFTDDLLATSVDTGRLSRALAVIEQVVALPGPPIPVTLLVDPELLDELEVMADTGTPYTVAGAGGKSVPGTGQLAARTWLDRLKILLLNHPEILVQLTPYGDPDVQSLTIRGMTWSSALPAAMATRVAEALADRPLDSSLAWPATGAISTRTLRELAKQGVSSVVLNSTAVVQPGDNGVAPGLTRLPGIGDHNVIAALISPAIEKFVAAAVTIDAAGSAALPALIAELAVRVAQHPEIQQAVTLTAPRYVDPNVDAAVRTIVDTSRSTFAAPISLRDAVSSGSLVPNVSPGHLAKVSPAATSKAADTLAAADYASKKAPAIRSLLDEKDAGAKAYEEALPIAVQRCESSAWREPDNADVAASFAEDLTDSVYGIMSGVHIVRPTSGSYTLASSSSPLPITVDNELPYPVYIRIRITSRQLGISTKDIGKQSVEPNQKHTFNIPTTVEYTGRISIQASLLTPNGDLLGASVEMKVRSTALGFVGVVITIVAGVVLALALLWRVVRRFRTRRVPDAPPAGPVPVDRPEPVR